MDDEQTEHLFSYGTLQLEAVQRTIFGRVVDGVPDRLDGYKTTWRRVRDPEVVRSSGKSFYPKLSPSGTGGEPVAGTVLALTRKELELADAYEVAGHRLVRVVLNSGAQAWVFIHD